MYHFHLVPLFSAGINFLAAVAIIFANPRRRINQLFFLLGIAIVDWNVGVCILAETSEPAKAAFWFRQCLFGIFFIPAILYNLAQRVTVPPPRRLQTFIPHGISALLLAAAFSRYGIVSGRAFGGIYRNTGGPAIWVFYLWFIVATAITLVRLFRSVRATDGSSERLTRFCIMAVSVLAAGIVHDSLHVLGLNYYPGTQTAIMAYGMLSTAAYGLLLSYYLLSEQLLDLRLSISRNGATVLRLLFLVGMCYLLLLFIGAIYPGIFTKQSLYASLGVLLVSTVFTVHFFPKIIGNHTRRSGERISGDRFECHDKIRAFIKEYKHQPAPFTQYLEDSIDILFNQFSLSTVALAIFEGDINARGQVCRTASQSRDWTAVFSEKSPLRTYFQTSTLQYIDIREGASFGPEERAARALMQAHSIILALPIGTEEKKPTGLLVIGPRRDGRSLNIVDSEILVLLCQHIAARVERIAVARNEELQRSNEAKDRFLASVNHEIRNPLNGINGILQMLKEHCKDTRSTYLLGTLQACTDQLRTTMDDVLDFNHIGPEVANNHPVETDIVQLVRSTTASYDLSGEQLIFDGSTGDFKEASTQDSQIRVLCDAGKFSHILTNYLTNALKYGIPSGAHVQLHGELIGGGFVRVKLNVSSTGPTLSTDELLNLFTPLTRGQRAVETKAHGMGLGLALCKKLAQAMNGNVGVESAHGRTTFWFVAEFPVANGKCAPANQPVFKLTGRRALAIEDEPYNRLVLGYHLNRFGISPVWAEDGQSALNAAQDRSFDLIVMDWLLPDMDGEELLSRLRAIHPTPLPPIVVVSAYSTDNKRATSFASGAAAFVNKPIDETKLAEALASCKLGPPVSAVPCEETTADSIDLSALKNASGSPGVVVSFLKEIERSHSNLVATWQTNPRAATSLAHRLKGQLLLVRARDCADLLAILENALNENRAPDELGRLMESINQCFGRVISSIRSLDRAQTGLS